MSTPDTVTISKDAGGYTLMHGGQKMSGKLSGDTLVLSMGGSNVNFTIDNTNNQLKVSQGTVTCAYDKK
jgi:hypothetical protein